MRPLLAVTLLLLGLLLPAVVAAAEPSEQALDKVYEAADTIDAARSELQAGRAAEADRLLSAAEILLTDARKLEPELARVGFEQARIHRMREDYSSARAALVASMRLDLELTEHVRMVELLDEVRRDLGQPPVGTVWRTSSTLRNAGVGALAGGLGLAAAGLAIAYVSFDQAADTGPTEATLAANRLGWALTGIGGGIGVAGGALTIVGQVRLELLRGILPGPWRIKDRGRDASFTLALRVTW